ncbi:MAG: hypothetical protein MJK04_23860 [Psychrosphaera sp.]|nr:hypothetical protein [Psychrosphaera sp.]
MRTRLKNTEMGSLTSRANFNWVFLFIIIFFGMGVAKADEKSQQLVDRVITAYGGDKLTNLKSLRVVDKTQSFSYGQSTMAGDIDNELNQTSVTLDLHNQRIDYRRVRGNKSHFTIEHQLFDGNKGLIIDHSMRTVEQNEGITYFNADRNQHLNLDTALVLLLHKQREQAEYAGTAYYLGELHDKVSFQAKGYPQMTLLINRRSGYIGKMMQAHWLKGQFFNYHFSDLKQSKGIYYAGHTYVSGDKKPLELTVARKVEFNPDTTHSFNPPADYAVKGQPIDFSQLKATKLADNVYLAGSNWGFSVFIDTGEYFAAAGGYFQLSKRFEAVKKLTNVDKPLKYLVVSHHHSDHLSGMKETAALGASFITVKAHIDAIREAAGVELSCPTTVLLLSMEKARLQKANYKCLILPAAIQTTTC